MYTAQGIVMVRVWYLYFQWTPLNGSSSLLSRNPSIYNIIRWVAWTIGQTNRRPSVWCSKYYFFHDFLQNSLQKYFQSICLFFLKNTKIKVKSFKCPKSIKSLKKIILGTLDAWSTIRLSNRPSDPGWIYLRLTDFKALVCTFRLPGPCPTLLWAIVKKR